MNAFFKMQLKNYFRMPSSYVTPVILGLFYIIIVISIKFAVKPLEANQLLKSNQYIEFTANLALFGMFMISSFITQTFFYKYRQEGIEFVIFSKPITRAQTYFANIFASFLGLFFSTFLLSVPFFISQLIIPLGFKKSLMSTLTFMAAGLLCAIVALSIGAIIQTLVESKVFQIIVAVIPFLSVLSFSFIKAPEQKDSFYALGKSVKNPPIFIQKTPLSNKKSKNPSIDNFEKKIKSQEDWFIENRTFANIFENKNKLNFKINDIANLNSVEVNDKKSIVDYIDKANKSFYNKVYWLNFREYFFPLYTAYDSNIRNLSLFVNYEKNIYSKNNYYYNFLDKKGNLNLSTIKQIEQEFDIDFLKTILIKTNDNKLYSLGYNVMNFNTIFQWDKLDEIQELIMQYGNIQDKAFESFKDFSAKIIDSFVSEKTIRELSNNYIPNNSWLSQLQIALLFGDDIFDKTIPEVAKIFLTKKMKLENLLNTSEIDIVNVYSLIHFLGRMTAAALNNDQNSFNITKNEINKKLIDPNYTEWKTVYTALAKINYLELQPLSLIAKRLDKYIDKNLDFKNLTDIQKSKIESQKALVKKNIINNVAKGFWTIQILKMTGLQNDNQKFKNIYNMSNLNKFLTINKGENFSKYANEYKNQSIFKLVELTNNMIKLKRKDPISLKIGVSIVLIFSLLLIGVGYILFKRKNFK